MTSAALLGLAFHMPTLKNIPAGNDWCNPTASEVSSTGVPRACLSLHYYGMSRVETLGMDVLPFPLPVQPSHVSDFRVT